MTRDDIIRMARKAAEETGTLVPTEWNDPLLERFAALVAAAEREACAKVCEMRKILEVDYEDERHYNQGIEHCAAAIRARGEA